MTEATPPETGSQTAAGDHTPVIVQEHSAVPDQEPAATDPHSAGAAPAEAQAPSSPELQAMEEDPEIKDVKTTLMDSAELSNRAANQALKAGADLHQATHDLIHGHATQRKHGLIVLAMFGVLTLVAMILFVWMSARLQQRIAQADAMLLAVGKRVVAMNEAVELISGTGEALRDIYAKQNTITSQQAKLDSRLDELMRATQTVMQTISQPTDPKNQDNQKKLMQAMGEGIQNNSNALKQLSTQLRSAPAANPQPGLIRREVEATMKSLQSKAIAPAAAASAPTPAPAAKPAERLVQYPRVQNQTP